MPTKAWWNFPLILSVFIHTAFSLPSFENTVILRTIELGGSVVHVTTSYTIRALEDEQKVFTVVLGRDEKAKTSWVEAKVKGQKEPLELKEHLPEAEKSVPTFTITQLDLCFLFYLEGMNSLTSPFQSLWELTRP